jgi:hypothetical protein
MVSQCRAGEAAGWRHFVAHYVTFIRSLLDRHFSELRNHHDSLLNDVLVRARAEDGQLFLSFSAQSEREFLVHLREFIATVAEEAVAPEGREDPLGWDVFAGALQDLSLLEKEAVWMILLAPAAHDAHEVLRIDNKSTAEALLKAQDALRGACDTWSADLLTQSRRALAEHARSIPAIHCQSPKSFLRLLDGEMTWRDRLELEHHTTSCWRCLDLLCRFQEVVFVAGQSRTLSHEEAEPYWKLLQIEARQRRGWKRLFGRA